MIEISEEEINEINRLCPYNQGIFLQPNGIPDSVKTHVVYSRWNKCGYSGGSCWGDEATPYVNQRPSDVMKVLDIILERKFARISYLDYRKIEAMIQSTLTSTWEYYGNCSDYEIEYIVLKDLLEFLNSIDKSE